MEGDLGASEIEPVEVKLAEVAMASREHRRGGWIVGFFSPNGLRQRGFCLDEAPCVEMDEGLMVQDLR